MTTFTRRDSYLLEGSERRPSDMHVRSGYPIWTLIDVWYARNRSDESVVAEYALDPAEWMAAKAYYFEHTSEIDARRALNNEPRAPLTGKVLLEDLLKEQDAPPPEV